MPVTSKAKPGDRWSHTTPSGHKIVVIFDSVDGRGTELWEWSLWGPEGDFINQDWRPNYDKAKDEAVMELRHRADRDKSIRFQRRFRLTRDK